MLIIDDAISDIESVRRNALAAQYIDWPGYDGEIYKRVCLTEVPGLQEAIEENLGPIEMLGTGYRLNFNGELPNAAIHSDMGWGTHAAVLYLSDGEGGTAFWRHKATGASRIDPGDFALLGKIEGDWDDATKWEQTGLCEIKMGRLVIYESAMFHSRWPFEAFGRDYESGRLIAVAFFTPKGEP